MNDQLATSSETKASTASGWGFPALARKAHYFVDGMSLCRHWFYLGQVEDDKHDHPDNCATCKRLQKAKHKAPVEVPADAPTQVPAQAAPSGLRLLCLLDQSNGRRHTGPRYLPVHTMYPVPPRSMVRGKWSEPRYAGLYLRETHAKRPTAEVLARIFEHGQTNALRADSRAVRAGVTA